MNNRVMSFQVDLKNSNNRIINYVIVKTIGAVHTHTHTHTHVVLMTEKVYNVFLQFALTKGIKYKIE